MKVLFYQGKVEVLRKIRKFKFLLQLSLLKKTLQKLS